MQPKILIVDDERSNIRILVDLLEKNYDIFIAKNAQQALDIATSDDKPDLILLDIVMPDMSGYEVCRNLKQDESTKNIPIIFTTSMDSEEDEEKGLQLGAIDYISKPYRLPIVKARVKNHLEMKRRGDLLEELICLDGLTGIPNRRRFDEFIDQEWRRATRQGSMISVILMDIDHFKSFNDHYGHAMGDDCLKTVGRTLSQAIKRSSDLVARYGGEEFVCVLTECAHADAIKVAENLRQSIQALCIPHEYSSADALVTISIGVASLIPTFGTTSRILVESADSMLYKAKESGRNRVACIEAG